MTKDQAEKEINYRISMAIVSGLTKQKIITNKDSKRIRNHLIDSLKPFIGRLERDL